MKFKQAFDTLSHNRMWSIRNATVGIVHNEELGDPTIFGAGVKHEMYHVTSTFRHRF